MENNNQDEIMINPFGLINLSRADQKLKKKNYKNSNLYNICYINASIQCLFRLNEFVKKIVKYNKGNLIIATNNLIDKMQNIPKNNKYCSVSEIKKAMGKTNDIYNNDEPEDANEFITNYLNELVEETKDSGEINWKCLDEDKQYFYKFYNKFLQRKGKSFILDLFYGLLRTEYYCHKCSQIFSIKFNSFNILELPLNQEESEYDNDKQLDMRDLLKDYISEKDNENEICPKCNINQKIKISINSLPKCLIIYFSRDYSNKKNNKINILKTINFENFVYNKSLNEDDNYFYHLKGIIFYEYYSKDISHYQAACLVNNEKWIYFDDIICKNDKNLLYIYENENPVCLFYEK